MMHGKKVIRKFLPRQNLEWQMEPNLHQFPFQQFDFKFWDQVEHLGDWKDFEYEF